MSFKYKYNRAEFHTISIVNIVKDGVRTSPILLIFSSLSLGENPRSLLSPKRILSPSSLKARFPSWRIADSRATARVDFPEAISH